MKKNDDFFLWHIVQCINKIEMLNLNDKDKFMYDYVLQDVTVRNLEVIGEAVKSLSMKLRNKNHHIPWRSMTGLRDVLAHEYFRIDLEIVWHVATVEIPKIKSDIERLLKSLE